MVNPFYGKDVISLRDFSRPHLEHLFYAADAVSKMDFGEKADFGKGRIIALLFFEPSTRTRLSFESAAISIGAHVIGFTDPRITSIEKGENLADTIRVVESYADAVVLRHPMEGAARYAADVASKPIINAGSGTEEHPTQAMVDLYTIKKEKGTIDGLNVAIVGDLKYGRAVYSLLYGLSVYEVRIFLVSPPLLRVRADITHELKGRAKISEYESLEEVIDQVDVIYATRIQKERFPDPHEYEKVKGSYLIDTTILDKGKRDAILLHPLPRAGEIRPEVDATPHARYFAQTRYGKVVREALLALILNLDLPHY